MERQIRAALYGRVSTEEQVEGYSLDAQSRAFQALVQGRGWTAYREYLDEGKSAHNDDIRKRPMFKEAIDDALAGKYDVLVVHKIDSFSRKLRITLEYFEKLGKAGVGFVSMQEQIDYSTPSGKLMLVMQGGLAEFYSDNLSQEVKKGLAERKAQGLYCGGLPFGAVKGENGVPVPDPKSYPGLVKAFDLAAHGRTDLEIARALNADGYRTVGPRGNRSFTTSSVLGIIKNRFYLGYLRDGKGGWQEGRHEALIDQAIWDQAQEMRRRRRTSTAGRCPAGKQVNTLTGIVYCWRCKGRIHSQNTYKGEPRLGCYNRQQTHDCAQRSANLSVYERQIEGYLATFHIPEDYQERLLEAHWKLETAYGSNIEDKAKLEGRLKRAKRLFELGDYTEAEYVARRDDLLRQLESLQPAPKQADHLKRLAQFLADVPTAWRAATQEQRNKLARTLFDQVWLEDKTVVAVKPRPELEPFFRLNYEDFRKKNIEDQRSTRVECSLFETHVSGQITWWIVGKCLISTGACGHFPNGLYCHT
jgi:DNA invertase Pin-like site-specific DNA recombinase